MRWLTWTGITALSSAFFIAGSLTGCAEGDAQFEPSGATTGSGGDTQQGSGGMSSGQNMGGNGSGASGASTSTGGTGGGTGGGNGGGPPTGLTYTGTILDGFTQMTIPAASVCSIDPMLPCVMTDGAGMFVYPGVPENSRVRVGATKDQYFPVESLIDTVNMNGTLTAFMLSNGIIQLGISSIGETWDQNLAAISVTVRDLAENPLPGYTVSLSQNVGLGPYYIDGTSIVQGATQTQLTGTAFFVNVPLGTYDINVSGPAVCNAAFIMDDTNQHTAPLINAAQFVIVFDCQ